MKNRQVKEFDVPLTADGIGDANTHIEEELERSNITKEIKNETMLVCEALLNDLIDQQIDQSIILNVSTRKVIGEIYIELGYEGKPYSPPKYDPDDISPEAGILNAFSEKISYHYSSGYNYIRIVVRRSHSAFHLWCFGSAFLAVLVGLMINYNTSVDTHMHIADDILFPLIKMFANAMLMVGAPITLFSMIRNMTEIYIIAKRSSVGRKLHVKTLITSVISIILSFGMSILLASFMSGQKDYLKGYGEAMSIADVIDSLVPSNIFEPFETFMPFPMIIVALLITYAFCSVGEYFDSIKKAVDICYALFSRMLSIVMSLLPFFCFLAVLTPIIEDGVEGVIMSAVPIILIAASTSAMFVFYIIRLLIGGVKIGPFLKKMPPLVRENLKINSAIDAVPFNIRYCVKNYGFDRKRISEKLPMLAQASLDGNCFFIMMIAMVFVFLIGIEASWLQIVVIAILILFLSFGAPNQPGSILIGTLIIIFYLKANALISVAIYVEIFFGVLQNLVNVISNIVTIAIEEQKIQKTQL
jgi:Na+/H+-dicarboxylate symporter